MNIGWRPPAELRHSPPRLVRLTGGGRALAGLMAALVAGAFAGGAALWVEAGRDRDRRALLIQEGVVAQATITALERTRGGEARYYIVLRYDAGGGFLENKARVGRGTWSRMAVGATLPVRYLPADPARSWIVGYEPKGVPPWLAPVVSIGLLAAAGLIGFVLLGQWRLVSEGRPVEARVTRSRRVYHTHGGGGQQVYYEFRVLSGALRTGHYGLAKVAPPAGTSLTILYHPDDPKHSARYPLSLVRPG